MFRLASSKLAFVRWIPRLQTAPRKHFPVRFMSTEMEMRNTLDDDPCSDLVLFETGTCMTGRTGRKRQRQRQREFGSRWDETKNRQEYHTTAKVSKEIYAVYKKKYDRLCEMLDSDKVLNKGKLMRLATIDVVSQYEGQMSQKDYDYCLKMEESYSNDLMNRL